MPKTASDSCKTLADLLRFRMGPRSLLARKNRTFNERFDPGGIVNGQGLPPVRELRYGVTDMAHAGCGIIAVYNAFLLLDNPQRLCDVAVWGDLHASNLLGLLGTFPWKAKCLFRQMGYTVTAARDKTLYDSLAREADVCLFSYWNRRRNPFKGMHTVCVRCRAEGLEVYNQFDAFPGVSRRASFMKWMEDGIGPVCLYCIRRVRK